MKHHDARSIGATPSVCHYPAKDLRERLLAGLAKMPLAFLGRLCPVCEGHGQYEQTYGAGCGGRSFQSMGYCEHCKGHGMTICGKPAPASVINQVMVAADAPDA